MSVLCFNKCKSTQNYDKLHVKKKLNMNYFQQISGIEGECDTEGVVPNDTVKEDDHSDRNN